jgi:hypothetical protein
LTEVHVDCDNIWSYEREFGQKIHNLDIYDSAVQSFDELFKRYGIKAKFFVVGRDLLLKKNRDAVKQISEHHDIGNHTFNHFSDYGNIEIDLVKREIYEADNIIRNCIGKEIKYFKSPGYSFRSDIHNAILNELKYSHDYSPTSKISIQILNLYAKIKKMNKVYKSTEYLELEKDYLLNVVKHTEFKYINLIANSTTCLKLKLDDKIKFLIKDLGGNNSFVFHAIDLMKNEKKIDGVPTLNIPYELRFKKVEKIIRILSEL